MARTVKLTAEQFAQKWATRTKAATGDMIEGVKRVKVAPGKLAVAQEEKMKAKLLESIESGKWRENTEAYSLEEWQKDMEEKGKGRVNQGVDRANGKVVHFATQLETHQNKGLVEIDGMADLTLSDSAQRMVAWMEHMAKMKYRKGK